MLNLKKKQLNTNNDNKNIKNEIVNNINEN